MFYTVLALVFLIFASLIYNEKRKGRWDFRGKIAAIGKVNLKFNLPAPLLLSAAPFLFCLLYL